MSRSEPEVSAVIDWVFNQPFVLSANFHDGAVVANYPFDDSHTGNGIKVGVLIFTVTKFKYFSILVFDTR